MLSGLLALGLVGWLAGYLAGRLVGLGGGGAAGVITAEASHGDRQSEDHCPGATVCEHTGKHLLCSLYITGAADETNRGRRVWWLV